MIPLRDDIPSSRFPIVSVSLIAINIIAFAYEMLLGKGLNPFLYHYGVVPKCALSPSFCNIDSSAGRFLPFFTSIFLHGGFFHLGGNMLYLWIFGDNVEDRMGHLRFFIFYMSCGTLAGTAHVFFNMASQVPAIGASGAIAGILGAYFKLFPRARVLTLITLGFYWSTALIPASFLLGFWFLMQLLSGTASLSALREVSGGVAWWAHVGGFAAGYALVALFAGQSSLRICRRYHDDYF